MVATRSVGVVCADLELGAVRDVGGLVVCVQIWLMRGSRLC